MHTDEPSNDSLADDAYDAFIEDETEDFSEFEIDIAVLVKGLTVDVAQIEAAVRAALEVEQVFSAVLSISVVGNAEIHRMNREYLQHDFPTDVISFGLEHSSPPDPEVVPGPEQDRGRDADIEGEIIVSAEMARDMASTAGWSASEELMLYVIHGVLHICGYDDLIPEEQTIMRKREQAVLQRLGIVQP